MLPYTILEVGTVIAYRLKSIEKIENLTNIKMIYDYRDQERIGDHICYYSNLNKLKSHYPQWTITKNLDDIFEDVYRH